MADTEIEERDKGSEGGGDIESYFAMRVSISWGITNISYSRNLAMFSCLTPNKSVWIASWAIPQTDLGSCNRI